MEDDAPSDPHALLQSPYTLSSLLPPSATAHAPTGIKTRSGLVLSAAQAHARKDHRAIVDAPAELCRGRSTMSDGDRMHPLLGAEEIELVHPLVVRNRDRVGRCLEARHGANHVGPHR